MKRFIMRKIFNITMLCSILAAVSCSNTVTDSSAENVPSLTEQTSTSEKGTTTVRMFVPDYYALAEQGSARVIAPQSVSARLSYNIPNLGWIGVNTVKLADAEKTPVENAPDNFTGSVYTISFDGIPIGTYEAGNLMIELLNAAGTTITAGTSTTTVEITKGGKDSTTFYTLPQVSDSTTGNLAAGEMKFSLQMLYTGIVYKVSMTTSGAYPDLVLFGADGKLINYYPIDSAEDAAQIEVESTGQYYVGVWADDGADIGRYSYSFGQLKYYQMNYMYAGVQYDAVVTTNGETYPDLVWFDSEGKLLHYYTIENADEAHIKLDITKNDSYTFILYGNDTDTYDLALGKLSFTYAKLVADVPYDMVVNSTEKTYPSYMLFNGEGKLIDNSYKKITSEEESRFTVMVESTGYYQLALYGMNPENYSLAFDLSNGTDVHGTISDDKLHWTVENSPYIITDNLWVREDKVLTIDAGVVVQFAGNYYIKVNGVINAQGTKEQPILFVTTGNNYNWDYIMLDSSTGLSLSSGYTYSSGSIFKHCTFIGANTPLKLNTSAYVDSCVFTENGNYVQVESNNSLLINNIFDNGLYLYRGSPKAVNNHIKSRFSIECDYASIKNNTFEEASIHFGWGNYTFSSNILNACYINRISDMYTGAKVTGNNFIGYTGVIIDVSGSSYSSRKLYNFTGNYWGEEQTTELEQKGDNTDISFFVDIYDNFNYTEIDYSGWATEPIENCGYSQTGFVAFDYTVNGYDFSNASGYYPESKNTSLAIKVMPQYCASSISKMRIAQSYEELKAADWTDYSSSFSYSVDTAKFINDAAMLHMQVQDGDGNKSAVIVHSIPFDTPKPKLSVKDGTVYDSAIKKQNIEYSATDLCNIVSYALVLDGSKVASEYNSWGTNFSSSYTLALAYMAGGEHTLKLTITDSAGNTGEETVSFTISRDFDSSGIENISYSTANGQFLKDANTLHLWHLDNDGKEDSGTSEISNYMHTNGGFEGAASYLYGDVPLDISTNAFTVEFWTRGSGKVHLNKESVFYFYNTYNNLNSYENYMYHYYTTTEGVSSYDIGADISARGRADDKWHCWAYVYTESYTAIYCDGVCVSYRDDFTHTLNTNNNDLHIEVNGIVDELRISNNARSADEISSYYKTAKPILDGNTVSVDVIVW